jgi:hypothetical protein
MLDQFLVRIFPSWMVLVILMVVLTAKGVITPGTTIIFTGKPVDSTTRSHIGFKILVAPKDKP